MTSTLEPWAARRSPARSRDEQEWAGEAAGIGTDRVRWIQTSLNRALGLRLPVNGVVDARTRSAIRSFQTRAGLTPDGKVGPLTIAALQRAGAPAPPAAPAAPGRAAPAGNTPRCPPPSQLTPAQRTVLAVTTNFETGVPFGCAVSKVDGISMGMLQWNLKAGTLQALFRQYEGAGGRLETHLGAEAAQVRALIALPPAQGVTVATTQGLANRWRDGLRALCGDPTFCNLQVRDIAGRLRTAEIAARELGLRTVRGLSMMFDVQVGDGYGVRRRKIGLFRDRIAKRGSSSERERLVEIANEAAEQAGARWREERRARRLVIANGTGRYRGSMWDLDRLFPGLDQQWEGSGGGAAPAPATQPPPQRLRPRDGLEPIHPERDRTPRPATPGTPAPLPSGCSVPARPLNERCLHPGTQQCPAIPNLMCLTRVGDVPFEYPTKIQRDPATGITVVQKRLPNHRQQFVPSVQAALQQFIANSRRFGLPFEAILTFGSLVCRCISRTDTPSNHSFGDAIDVVGVRWPPMGGPASRFRETIVHNFRDPGQRALLRRLNACLRLSFATVIDYHAPDHRDHFHCDMNRGRGRTFGPTTLRFTQEALGLVLGRPVPITGRLDAATKQALKEFARAGDAVWSDRTQLARTLDQLFTRVAMGR